jgi:1-deoxy-D-xylulose-5-phosphate reductoisomerase
VVAPGTIAIVGSTGSIGTQTLDVIRAEPDRYRVVALATGRSIDVLAAQAAELRPDVVAVADLELGPKLEELVGEGIEVRAGPEAMASIATEAGTVLNAVVGFAGLPVTIAALRAGARLALANKESLVAGGPVVAAARATTGAELIPVDSEHSAIHQCLRGQPAEGVDRLVLTASGGPFRGRRRDELAGVTLDDALAHPTWRMGPKITIDSSTLMNKGLEVIEAHELFGIDYDRIDVVVHPQSVVHSMVSFVDGSTLAQLSMPDMRLPIAYALAYPDRATVAFGAIDWANMGALTFDRPDVATFRCLGLAYEAGRVGGTAPAWLNAANEVAVAGFLDGLIGWLAIADVIEETLQGHDGGRAQTVDDILDADRRARDRARQVRDKRANDAMSQP